MARFSPDGRRVAIEVPPGRLLEKLAPAEKRRLEESFLLLDGQKRVHDAVRDFVFSPDGASWSYVATQGPRSFVVVNGKAGAEFDEIAAPLLFTRGTGGLAYAARRDRAWRVVVDGAEGEPYDEVGELVLSPDGKTAAYAARRGDAWRIVHGTDEGPAYDEVKRLLYSPEGGLAYAARKEAKWDVVHGKDLLQGFEFVQEISFGTYDRRRLVAAKREGAWWILHGPTPLRCVSKPWFPTTDAKGRRVYVSKEAGEASILRVEGRQAEAWDDIRDLRLDPRGEILLVGQRRKSVFIVRGETAAPVVGEIFDVPLVSESGESIAYVSRVRRLPQPGPKVDPFGIDGKWSVIFNGRKGEEFDAIDRLVMDPAGNRVEYGARLGSDLWWKSLSRE